MIRTLVLFGGRQEEFSQLMPDCMLDFAKEGNVVTAQGLEYVVDAVDDTAVFLVCTDNNRLY